MSAGHRSVNLTIKCYPGAPILDEYENIKTVRDGYYTIFFKVM